MDINKKWFAWFNVLILLVLFSPKVVQADATDWGEALSFLREKFPSAYVHVGDVVETNGNRVVFKLKTGTTGIPARGSELMATCHEPDIPVYLQKESGIIKVISVFEDKVLAQGVKSLGGRVEKGDFVVMPASPTVYLQTNIRDRESFLPYQKLLQGLIDEQLEVVEIRDSSLSGNSGSYGVLLRLDAGDEYLALKLQSLYSGNTFYSGSVPLGANVALLKQPGSKVKGDISPKHRGPASAPEPPAQMKEEYFPLEGEYKRFVFADMDADGRQELVLLNNKGIFGFKAVDGNYRAWDSFLFKNADLLAIHLHCGDMDLDGKDELLVTLAEKTEHMGKKDHALRSMILTYGNGTFAPLDDRLPFYLRTIEGRDGKEVFIGQASGKHDPYAGPVFQIRYDTMEKKVVRDQLYKPAAEVYSLYQFNLDPFDGDHLLVLEPNNDLSGYHAAAEEIGAISPRNYGAYEEISYPVKLRKEDYSQGGFKGIGWKTVFAPRRFELKREYDHQVFLINKERTSNFTSTVFTKILGKSSAKDQILGIKWQGKKLVETWASEEIERDIIDFCFAGDSIHVLARNTNGDCYISTIDALNSF